MPHKVYPRIEAMLLESVGAPIPRSEFATGKLDPFLIAAIFFGLGGLVLVAWIARNGP